MSQVPMSISRRNIHRLPGNHHTPASWISLIGSYVKTWHRSGSISLWNLKEQKRVQFWPICLFARKRCPLRQGWWPFLPHEEGNGSGRDMQIHQRWLTEKDCHGPFSFHSSWAGPVYLSLGPTIRLLSLQNPSCGIASLNVFLIFKIRKVPIISQHSAFWAHWKSCWAESIMNFTVPNSQPMASSPAHTLCFISYRDSQIPALPGCKVNHCRESQKRWSKSALCHIFLWQTTAHLLVSFLLCEVGNTSMCSTGLLCLNDQERRIRKSYTWVKRKDSLGNSRGEDSVI